MLYRTVVTGLFLFTEVVMRTRFAPQRGFTVIELLTVTAVIGILAALALPQLQHKDRAHDRQAQAALRNTALAEESYFVGHNEYVSCDEATCGVLLGDSGLVPSGVILTIESDGFSFKGTARHSLGSGAVFHWN